MPRQLMRITPNIVAAAREYLELKREGTLPTIHVAECYPISPESVLEIWEHARFDLLRMKGSQGFELSRVTVFKDGSFVAEHACASDTGEHASLFDGI